MDEGGKTSKPVCWVVTDGRAGIESQALGLAEAIAEIRPIEIVVKRIAVRAPWNGLHWRAWGDALTRLAADSDPLDPPYPDLWIGCGRLSVALTITLKERARETFTVQLQDPRAPTNLFDLVIPPEHDGLSGANVFSIIGSPNRVKNPNEEPNSRKIAALIGGTNRVFNMPESCAVSFVEQLGALADAGNELVVTTSRRSPPGLRPLLRNLAKEKGASLWIAGVDAPEANPYPAMLGDCRAIIVTEDSVNMAVEAASTGKPVYIAPLERKPFAPVMKFDAFHESLHRRGIARKFEGAIADWSYEPLNETRRAAEEVLRRWGR